MGEEAEAAAAARAHWVGQFNTTSATTSGCAINEVGPQAAALQEVLARPTLAATTMGVVIVDDDTIQMTTTAQENTQAILGRYAVATAELGVTLGRAQHLKMVATPDLEVNMGCEMSLKLKSATKQRRSGPNSASWNMSMSHNQRNTSTKISYLHTGAMVALSP